MTHPTCATKRESNMAQNARHAGEAHALPTRICYEVEVNGSFETKELPFVLGVLADASK